MSENAMFSFLAVLGELNDREFKKRLAFLSRDLHYYATVASSIIGAENSKRIRETPDGVAHDSEEFAARLLNITDTGDNEIFREMIELFLIGVMQDELKFCCFNCKRFTDCLDIEHLTVGELFRRRVYGEDTPELRKKISGLVQEALKKTPHVNADKAYLRCSRFEHQYAAAALGEVFSRYADIASALQKQFGISYEKIQKEIIAANMAFFEKAEEAQLRKIPEV
jgi:hypothetical protein